MKVFSHSSMVAIQESPRTYIERFSIKNSGPIASAEGQQLGRLNLIIGENSCGKTWLLKTLYCVVRAQEEFGRGNDKREFNDVLTDKLYWTFQSTPGEMVRRGKGNRLDVHVMMNDGSELAFDFGPDTNKQVRASINSLLPRHDNVVFLPPKEVLSLWNVIVTSTQYNREFGYDATYADLVLALQVLPKLGGSADSIAREKLELMFKGRVAFEDQQWVYKRGNSKFSIHSTAEGIKKIAILDNLLGNGYLSPGSILFIDEPESALHPTAIIQLLDVINILAGWGVQVFMATHSYYVAKKMLLIAKKNKWPVPCFAANKEGDWQQSCLLTDGLPDTEIINESIRLFEQGFEGI